MQTIPEMIVGYSIMTRFYCTWTVVRLCMYFCHVLIRILLGYSEARIPDLCSKIHYVTKCMGHTTSQESRKGSSARTTGRLMRLSDFWWTTPVIDTEIYIWMFWKFESFKYNILKICSVPGITFFSWLDNY